MPFIPDSQPQAKKGFVPDAKQRTGMKKWLLGDRTSIPGMAYEAGANILNLPSYAIGGMMDEFQKKGVGAFNPLKNPFGLAGAFSGIKNKEAVFTELPESFGIDPNSGKGMALGFAGELLTPGLPLGKIANVFKGSKAASRLAKAPNVFSKIASKFGGVSADAGEALLLKSYKLNATDIDKIAKSIGVTNEGEKATKVLAYLEGLGLKGSTKDSARMLDELAQSVQKKYNALVRTGKPVSRQTYIEALLKQADDLSAQAGDPNTRMIVMKLREEAKIQLGLVKKGVPMTDDFLTNTKTKAFSSASPGQLSSPFETGFNEQIGRAGVNALDTIAPGSSKIGTRLRGIRTTQDVVGKQARTGLGTQLINSFKPGAVGFGVGAGYGYTQGENPLVSGAKGAFIGAGLNSPQVLNIAGKTLSGGKNFSPAVSKGFGMGMNVAKKVPVTAARLGGANLNAQQSGSEYPSKYPRAVSTTTSQNQEQYNQSSTYPPIVPPTLPVRPQKLKPLKYKSPDLNLNKGNSFGSTKKVTRGSFY